MLLLPDRWRNCSFGMLSPSVLCELARILRGGRVASGRVGLLGPYPLLLPTGHASCCATYAECMLTLLSIPVMHLQENIPCRMVKLKILLKLMRQKIDVLHDLSSDCDPCAVKVMVTATVSMSLSTVGDSFTLKSINDPL